MAGIAAVARLALAASPAAHWIDIPAEDLGTALLAFAAATHQQIAFDYRQVEGYRSTALSGTYTVTQGLKLLIGTTPFLIRATPSGVLTVASRPVHAGAAPGQRSLPGEPGSSASHAPAGEIIISAGRAQLASRVGAFVNEISVLEQGEGLARWHVPVCPEVVGLPRESGEFILERISEIAREAGVPLADEDCRPNLFVFVISEPQRLLKAMRKRLRALMFGHAALHDIDELIANRRAVRVWYNAAMTTVDNMAPTYVLPPAARILPEGGAAQGGDGGTAMSSQVISDWEGASRVAPAMVWAFTRVYIIVDLGRLQGVTRGQLADYLAMVGLARIKPGAQLSDAPTILKLFDGAPQAALQGMSDWDRAFLRSLYAAEGLQVQTSEVALDTVREIVR